MRTGVRKTQREQWTEAEGSPSTAQGYKRVSGTLGWLTEAELEEKKSKNREKSENFFGSIKLLNNILVPYPCLYLLRYVPLHSIMRTGTSN